jgi:calcineurin-like phosphoesterase family protein
VIPEKFHDAVLLPVAHTWFGSDLHLGDLWTSRMRFRQQTADIHDRVIRDDWDKKVVEGDTVVLLGDIQRGIGDDALFSWISERPGTKILVCGNWDSAHRENGEAREGWEDVFELIVDELTIHFDKPGQQTLLKFLASHYPYGLSYPKPKDTGEILFHGHTHRKQSTSFSDDGTLQIHVGWDTWRGLVSASDIIALADTANQKRSRRV